MKLFFKVKQIRKFAASLLILNFLVVTGLVSYHYHTVNLVSGSHHVLHKESTNTKTGESYTYYTCPVIQYASSAFNIYFEKKICSCAGLKLITIVPSLESGSFFFQEFQLASLRAPPTFS